MDSLHTGCAGLDVHKDSVVACLPAAKAARRWQLSNYFSSKTPAKSVVKPPTHLTPSFHCE
jgi:hypothetical protein